MKGYLKFIALIITAAMFFSMLAGCSSNDNGGTTETTTEGTTEGGTEQTTAATEIPDNSWEIDTSPFSVDWYLGSPGFSFFYDSEKRIVHKTIFEETGLKEINHIIPADSNNEKLNALIAAGTLPDIITIEQKKPQVNILVDNDLVFDLEALSNQYAPGFVENINPGVFNWHRFDDDVFYGYPSLTKPADELTDEELGRLGSNVLVLAREDMMAEYDIKSEDFGTQDGMVEALKKVKGAQYNEADVFPILVSADRFRADIIAGISTFFGFTNEDEDGNWQMKYTSSPFREMTLFLNRLYREGLLEEENLLMKNKHFMEYISNGNVFCMMGVTGVGTFGSQMLVLYDDSGGKATFTAVEPPSSKDNNNHWQPKNLIQGWQYTFISKNAKNPERIIRLFEYLIEPEKEMMIFYGIEGEHYNLVNGRVKWTPEVQKIMDENPVERNDLYGFPNSLWQLRSSISNIKYKPIPDTPQRIYYEELDDPYGKYLYVGDALNIKDNEETTDIKTKVDLYLDEKMPQIILAESEEECVKLLDESIEHILELGYEDILQPYYNEKFHANKEKLRVDFVYPGYPGYTK